MSPRAARLVAACAAGLLTALAGCAAAPPPPSAADEQGRIGHWDLLLQDALQALEARAERGAPPAFLDSVIARGEHLEMRLLVARGRVPAPEVAADEVLIFIEGAPPPTRPGEPPPEPCVLEVAGEPFQVEPGTIAVLPAGSRGALQPWSRPGPTPLCALVVRATRPGAAAPDAEPWVKDIGALDPQLKPAHSPSRISPVVTLPGRIGLYTYTVCDTNDPRYQPGIVPNQRHAKHDEVLLVLSGEGNIGLGAAGHRLKQKSIVLIPQGLLYTFQNDDRRGTRALLVAAPPAAGEDVQYEITPATEKVRPAPPPPDLLQYGPEARDAAAQSPGGPR